MMEQGAPEVNEVKIDKNKLVDALWVQLSGYNVLGASRDPEHTSQWHSGYEAALRDVLDYIRSMPCEVRVAWKGVSTCK